MLAIIVRLVNRIRKLSVTQPRPVSRAWFSPSFKRCLRPCTPPVRLFSVYSVHVQPSIRQSGPKECATDAPRHNYGLIGWGPFRVVPTIQGMTRRDT
eukprot:scaffold309_cov136-Isochrysis_galbana.AAC.5